MMKEKTHSSISYILQLEREKKGLTQKQLAERADVTYSTITKIEGGFSQNPTSGTIVKLSRALEINVGVLLGFPEFIDNNKSFRGDSDEAIFTFIDLFAGIGGLRIAFEKNGGKCVFTSEIDKFASKTYEVNFGEIPFGDIKKINENSIPDHDVIVAGFPCQPFSIAGVSKKNSLGKQHGFLDETKGTLFFDIARIIKAKRPKILFLENVKNLVSHDKGKTFKVIKKTIEDLDYTVYSGVFDGKFFVPQHRERTIIIGFDNRVFKQMEDYNFPALPKDIKPLSSILESDIDEKYTLSPKLWGYLQDYAEKHRKKGNGFGYGMANLEGITRTLSARYYKDGSEILIPQKGNRPRRLTPRECARLQGYPDDFLIPVSDTQAYKQFGNSVVVPLMECLASSLVGYLK